MKYKHPLKQILRENRPVWDIDATRPAVRNAFSKVLKCGTAALGAELYSSDIEDRIVFHTCKSRACSSCGTRATMKWQRERWAALPNVQYKAITFTMPDLLWPFFRNRRLMRILPILAARTVECWTRAKLGIRVGIIAIPHTFNGRLDFNSHVHVMVTAGGMQGSGGWRDSISYDRKALTQYWRKGVIRVLRIALRAGIVNPDSSQINVEEMIAAQERRWWSVKLQSVGSKEHFLRYAGRYARRPPIAQRRIVYFNQHVVKFIAKDKRSRRLIMIELTPKEFISAWVSHLPEHYEHTVRSFGLFSARTLGNNPDFFLSIPNHAKRPRPKPLRWNISIMRDFGWDPLRDRQGNTMKWTRRIAPLAQ